MKSNDPIDIPITQLINNLFNDLKGQLLSLIQKQQQQTDELFNKLENVEKKRIIWLI